MGADINNGEDYVSVDAALAMCQVELGDHVVLECGSMMQIDYFNSFRCWMGLVEREGKLVTNAVHMSKLVPKMVDGEFVRELRVMSGAFPLIERRPVAFSDEVLGG
mgnify:FL=1